MAGAPMRAAASICAKLRRNEQRDLNAGVAELGDIRSEQVGLAVDVEAAFGGAFGALLRHEAGGVRLGLERNRQHLGVAAISRLRGTVKFAASRAMSSSLM